MECDGAFVAVAGARRVAVWTVATGDLVTVIEIPKHYSANGISREEKLSCQFCSQVNRQDSGELYRF